MANNVEKILKDEIAAWNSHDADKIVAFYTDDCAYEDMAFGAVNRGKKELKTYINSSFVAFHDMKFELLSRFNSGDRGAEKWTISGTHAGDVPGMPATGKRFSIRGASVMELRNGKIIRNSNYWNLASFLQQVGF